jgi:hypothetical protein
MQEANRTALTTANRFTLWSYPEGKIAAREVGVHRDHLPYHFVFAGL